MVLVHWGRILHDRIQRRSQATKACPTMSPMVVLVPPPSMRFSFPCTGWKALQKARSTCPEFSISTILSFFLDSRERDGKPSANFKAVVGDNKPIRLIQAGYVSKIQLVRVDSKVFFTAQCQPEMRTASDYKIRFAVESTLPPPDSGCPASVSYFPYSECTGPAGKGPRASCKHIAAVLYALEEFSCLGLV